MLFRSIQLRSIPGEGSTFTLYLPIAYVGSALAPQRAQPNMAAPMLSPQRAPSVERVPDDRETIEPGDDEAGSQLIDNPLDPKGAKLYLANDGDVICVSNFETALLDVPIESSKDDPDRAFVAFTQHIPAVETKVVVILEPVPDAKKSR